VNKQLNTILNDEQAGLNSEGSDKMPHSVCISKTFHFPVCLLLITVLLALVSNSMFLICKTSFGGDAIALCDSHHRRGPLPERL
jgi:hypothetical protein